MSRRTRSVRWLLPAALLVLQAGRAAAQVPARDTLNPVALEGVVVSVLRTPVVVTDVPFSLAVRDERQIQQGRPGLGLEEALRGIPGVQVDNRYNFALGERISIRGFGARAQFGVRGVKVLVDGIPATLPDGQSALSHLDFGALGRAEVIRGPASSLYGNAAGGVIQLSTREPPATPLGQEVQVVAGEDGLLRLQSTTGGRSGRSWYQLNLSRMAYDGYREFSDAENRYLNAHYAYRGDRNELRIQAHAVDYDANNPGSLSDSLLRVDRSRAFANNVTNQTGEEGRQGQVGALWRRALPGGGLEVAGYGLTREIDNPIPGTIVDVERRAGGLRAIFHADPLARLAELRWSVGAEADRQDDDRRNFRNLRGERDTLSLSQQEQVDNLGVFAQLAARPTARLGVMGGVRYDWIRFEAEDRFVRANNPDDSGSRTMDAVSPSLGITYAVAEPLALYANVATSFETPTTTELANRPTGAGGFNPGLEPQRATSYEAGARGSVGRRAAYQLTAYHADVRNEVIGFEVPQAPGRTFFRNAGSATHRGVEAMLRLAPLVRLTAQLSYTYTDARFDTYRTASATFDGNQIPGVAPHRVDLALGYQGRAGWFVGADTRHSSRLAVNDANSAFSPAYTVTDLRAGWDELRLAGVRLSPFVGVTNLFDETYNTSVVINAFGGRFYEPGPARSLYAGARIAVRR